VNKLQLNLLHVPVGLAAVFLAFISPVLCGGFCFGFVAYEIIQEIREPNKGWYDLSGFLWGIVLGGVIWILAIWTLGVWGWDVRVQNI